MRVLITGAAGSIGSALRAGLGSKHELRTLDRARSRGGGSIVADAAKGGRRFEAAFERCDAVVDLAGVADADASWDVVRTNNMRAAMNTLEAARRHGVARVVYASSNHVTGGYELDDPYARIVAGDYGSLDPHGFRRLTTADPIRPDGAYALGKAFAESAARYYGDQHGVSTLCLRIGTFRDDGLPRTPRHFATLLTPADLVRLVSCALEAPESLRFGIYYGVSANTWRIWELEDAREDLGYEPQDDAERFR